MLRHRGVEHVDADDAVADHEEDGSEEHDPLSGHAGPPDGGGEPEDVDWDTHREDRLDQAGLQQGEAQLSL